MKTNEILHLADLNLAESMRETARWNAASEIVERDDLLLIRGADSSPVTNAAVRIARGDDSASGRTMDLIKSFYGGQSTMYSVHIRGHADAALEAACQRENMVSISNAPGMMIDAMIPGQPLPADTEVRTVTDAAAAADFAAVAVDSYKSLGMPPEIGAVIFASPGRCLVPSNHMVVAYRSGKPVSCAMTIFSHSIAGVYWVGTIAEARGRGMAEACTRTVANAALARGARIVVLQASKFGEPIYRRMGFREFTGYPWYFQFNTNR